eukprot:10760262-Ditylum_brightwellii.AAC.1
MAHKVVGEGHTEIPNGDGTYSKVHVWHTPTMPTAVLSPGELVQRHRKLYKSNTIYCNEDEQTGYIKFHSRVSSCDVIMNRKYNNKKALTLPLVPTSSASGIDVIQDEKAAKGKGNTHKEAEVTGQDYH